MQLDPLATVIDDEAEPGSWADAIEHSPCLVVREYEPERDQ